MQNLSVRKLSIRNMALIALVTLLSACSNHDFDALEKQLPSIEKFAPLAELVESHGNKAIIDFRHDPVRIEPPALAKQVSEKWLAELKQSDIKLVTSNSYFGGSLFVKNDNSLLLSGSVSGWVHFAKDGGIYANVVPDIDAYVAKVREKKPDADKFMLVKRINDHWGIFLHAY